MLLVSNSRNGIGVIWEPQDGNTNVWILHEVAEGFDTAVYTNKRSALPNEAVQSTSK
jgi:hypothetical protein